MLVLWEKEMLGMVQLTMKILKTILMAILIMIFRSKL
jgi:hypothetical protein